MKKSILRVMAMALAMVLILATFASCGQQGKQGPAGPKGEQGIQGEKGEDGNGISSIVKTSTEGLVDTYTITFTDGKTTTFTVTNGTDGEQGIQGIQGVKGEDGHTPVITIQNGYWYIDGVNTNQSAIGVSGSTGNGISNIAKTSTEGLVDTYTITYTNGTTTTFTVTNGVQGIQGIQGVPGKDGHSPVITIQDGYWYIDGVNTNEAVGEGVKGDTGNGISSIAKTNTDGLVDTYTITFTDGTTTTFTVTNGADGNDGKDGINGTNGKDGVDGEDGKDGADGKTPYIKDGYWWIGDTNTNVKAEGTDGKDGQNGTNGKDGVDGEDGKDGQDGADGQTPYIKDGYWWIGDTNTNVKAEGTDGKDGQNGTNGKDGVDGEDGKDGQDGADGQTPYIKDGYWWIGDTNTNVKAEGSDGKDGQNGADGKDGVDGEDGKDGQDGADGQTPYIKDGYWWIGDTNTNVKAEGSDGKDGQNGADGKDGVDGEDGKDGQDGADGQTPYIKDGYWWIGDTNTNVKAEGTDGKDGQNGTDGEDGKDGIDGEDGKDGADGVSVVNAYVDENLHLWIVLSNGTKIDAGYVGVTVTPTPTTYTVTFVDYNGTTLKTETVESGKSATAPADPTKSGYRFTGWDVAYNNITSNTTVTAQYIQQFTVTFKDYDGSTLKTQTVDKGSNATPPANPSRDGYEFASWSGTYTNVTTNQVVTATYTQLVDTRNLLEMTYVDNQDGTLTLTVAVKGNVVNFAGIEGYVSFDTSKLTFSSRSKLSSLSGSVNYDSSDSNVYFSLADSENLTEAEHLFSIVLTYEDAINTQITLTITDIYDQDYNTETYTVVGGNVVIG